VIAGGFEPRLGLAEAHQRCPLDVERRRFGHVRVP
jgi:hypothetical protein